MNLDLPEISNPGQWALEISAALGATEYINAPGGTDLFDESEFKARGIRLTIQEPAPFIYACPGYKPVADLSIIDVMMWNTTEQILAHLDLTGNPA